jgi:hypothetical protein
MKILVISDYRATVSVRPEAEAMIGLKTEFNYDITIMTFGDAPYVKRFKEAGIRVIDFHPIKKFSWKYIRTIRNELKEGDYDVLQLFNNKALINGQLSAIGLPVKVVAYRGYTGNIHWAGPFYVS